MTGTENQKQVALPERLRGQFAALEQRLWRTETLTASAAGLGSLLLSYALLFLSDRLWNSPVWFRTLVAALGWAGVVGALVWWSRRWWFQRRGQRALAVLVQQKYRRLGDRLLGIVELADEEKRPSSFSPALYRAAIEQVATEAEAYDFTVAADRRPERRLGWIVLACALSAALPWLVAPGAAGNALHRWAAPFAAVDWFTLVALEGLPRERVVAHGEPFELEWQVHYRSIWRPGQAVCRIQSQPRIVARRQGGTFRVRVPGQVQGGVLRVRLGDAWTDVAIKPMHRPSLKALQANLQLPSYLQYPAEKEGVESGLVNVLEGSQVAFVGEASRPLSRAELQLAEGPSNPLTVSGEKFSSAPVELDNVTQVSFRWSDQNGLEGAAPWRLQVHAQKDSPPTPELVGVQKDTAILETEVLDVKAAATDDYGVRELGFSWELLGETTTNLPTVREFKVETTTPREKKREETFHFSPGLAMIPADSVIELRGFATDYFPGRVRSETPVYRLHVLGLERHAELVRQNLESLLSHLEDVTRLEEKVAASTRELQGTPKDKLKDNDVAEPISAAKEDQKQNAQNLEQLADEGKKTLREAFRNPTFTEQTLRDWMKNLQGMQQLADQKMQQAAKALEKAQHDPEARAENLSQAQEKEQEILQELEEMQRRVNKGLDQLQALTLAQRLRKISSDEKEIAGRLQKIVPDNIGLLPNELPNWAQNAEKSLSRDQEGEQKETQVLHDEIGRFFERTQKENYGEVHKAMADAHVVDELDRLRAMIQENVAMSAIQNLGDWSDRLNAWAAILEPKSDKSDSGNGGQSNQGDEAALKELMALLRVRDREVGLRHRTGLLDKEKANPEVFGKGVKVLAADQEKVRGDVTKIQSENPIPALEFPLQDIIDTMAKAEGLLNERDTGRETDLVQTRAIEQVSDLINLINEQQQRGNNNRSSQSASEAAAEMNFLMQMMAAQAKPAFGAALNPLGGGNRAGGTTDRASDATLGGANGQAGEARRVSRASGNAANLPTEFRDALENYFKAMEKLESK